MPTQYGNPYIMMFSILSGVTLSCILSHLNILCISPVRQHYIKILIHRSRIIATYMFSFSNLQDFIGMKRVTIKRSVLYQE